MISIKKFSFLNFTKNEPFKITMMVNASFSDLDNQLKVDLLDAIGQVVNIGVNTILSAETTPDINEIYSIFSYSFAPRGNKVL